MLSGGECLFRKKDGSTSVWRGNFGRGKRHRRRGRRSTRDSLQRREHFLFYGHILFISLARNDLHYGRLICNNSVTISLNGEGSTDAL